MVSPVLLAHAAATLFLVGMIWTVQIVHYPLFTQVGAESFIAYEAAHSVRITWTIALPWAVQGLTIIALFVAPPSGVSRGLVVAAAVLAVAPVAVTVLASVPAHEILGRGYDGAAHARLVATNWLRTAAWTAGGGLALWMLTAHHDASLLA